MLKAVHVFHKRIIRLQQLYDFVMHSFTQVTDDIRADAQAGLITAKDFIPSKHGFVKQYRMDSILHHVQHTFPKELRSLLLIGLVSEFEVFLVAHAQKVASRAKLYGRKNAILEWQRHRLAAFDTIESIRDHLLEIDTRALTSGGFDKIQEYYESVLDVKIAEAGIPLTELREIHTRRHLHVHRRGLVDAQYIHDFDQSAKLNAYLEIPDAYLKTAFSALRKVAKYLVLQCDAKFPPRPSRLISGGINLIPKKVAVQVRAKFADETQLKNYFALDRAIEGSKKTTTMGKLLIGGRADGLSARWIVAGGSKELQAYFEDLKFLTGQGSLSSVQHERVSARANKPHHAINRPNSSPEVSPMPPAPEAQAPLDNQADQC